MCGIVGCIALGNNRINLDVDTFISMNDSLAHRGPDGEGFAFFGNSFTTHEITLLQNSRPQSLVLSDISCGRDVFLGHRRLSIIDRTTSANQPMQDDSGNITIVFNGEIYNHAEIRKELSLKYRFKTDHSDTEVIIYAYKEWGEDFVYRLRGMFAIALWDREKDLLLLIRDRLGVKPLYYAYDNDKLLFASEIKALLRNRTMKREINYEAMYNYLSFLTTPPPQTLFDGIFKLHAGSYIKIDKGLVGQQTKYWDVLDNTADLKGYSEEEIKIELLKLLKESVAYRGIADIPIGVFLSGGIDSSLNAKLFSDIADYKVKAFSVGYENDSDLSSYKNEFEWAKKAAEFSRCEYYQRELTQDDLLEFLPKLIYHQDEPIGDPVCMPLYYVSKLAKENGITVCQVGEGSDELFWGYGSWKTQLLLYKLNSIKGLGLFKKILIVVLKLLGKEHEFYYEYLKRGSSGQNIFWGGAEAFTETQKQKLLTKKFRSKLPAGYTSWQVIQKYYDDFLRKAKEKSQLNWMTYIDLNLRLPELLLMRVDKMSMAVALEARVPFLDHKFVEFAMGIPSELKTKKNELKYILKKSISGVIPDDIIYRKKQGFDTPVHDWIFDRLGDVARDNILEFAKITGYLDPIYVNKLFLMKKNRQLWFLLNLSMWWKYYIVERRDLI